MRVQRQLEGGFVLHYQSADLEILPQGPQDQLRIELVILHQQGA